MAIRILRIAQVLVQCSSLEVIFNDKLSMNELRIKIVFFTGKD
jgi:hypothetical protein